MLSMARGAYASTPGRQDEDRRRLMSAGRRNPPGSGAWQRAQGPRDGGVAQPKAAAPGPRAKTAPAAPAAYKPQPTPKVLQTKRAVGAPAVPARSTQPHAPPSPPPVYRPQPPPRVLQAKSQTKAPPAAAPTKPAPAPSSRRATSFKVVQAKTAAALPPPPRRATALPRRPAAPAPAYPRAGAAPVIQRDTFLDIERLEELRSISRVLRGY